MLIMNEKDIMIERHLKARDIDNPDVIDAMREVNRELFVPDEMKEYAYRDGPLPIGKGQTISQPYIVAYMAQLIEPDPGDVVLEVGSGCGYNAAVLSKLVTKVYSVEIIEWLSEYARENLEKAGIENVEVKFGDGYRGWQENAPFDKIMLTAAAPGIPQPLKEQMKVGGKLLAPVDNANQKLILLVKTGEDTFREEDLIPVRFVPMTGEARK